MSVIYLLVLFLDESIKQGHYKVIFHEICHRRLLFILKIKDFLLNIQFIKNFFLPQIKRRIDTIKNYYVVL